MKLRFGILLTVCTTLEDLSCKLTNLAYFTQAKYFMDWSWLLKVANRTQTQNYKPFQQISQEFYTEGTKHLFIFVAYPRKLVWSFQLKWTVHCFLIIIIVSLFFVTISFPFISTLRLVFTNLYWHW